MGERRTAAKGDAWLVRQRSAVTDAVSRLDEAGRCKPILMSAELHAHKVKVRTGSKQEHNAGQLPAGSHQWPVSQF